MRPVLKKLLPRGFAPTVVAALFTLMLAAPSAQAHKSTSHRGHHCSCDAGAHHTVKKGAKHRKNSAKNSAKNGAKITHKRATAHVAHNHLRQRSYVIVRSSTTVVTRHTSTPGLSAGYRRVLPEPNCNMEPPFAVPACEARLKAAQRD